MKTSHILLITFAVFSLFVILPLSCAYALDSAYAEQGYYVYENGKLNYEPDNSQYNYDSYSYKNNEPTSRKYNSYQNSYSSDKSYYSYEYSRPSYSFYNGYSPSKLKSVKFIYYPSDTQDSSYWRVKQPFYKEDYLTEEYGYDHYYSPRLSQDETYNWRY